MPIKSQSWSNPKADLEPIRTQSLSASGANPCQSGVNFSSPPKAADCPIHANVCQHSPIRCRFKLSFSIMFKFANQCQFNIPLTVNSTSILQSDTILPPLPIITLSTIQSVPILANPMPILTNSVGPGLAFDWRRIGSGLAKECLRIG